MPLRRAVAFLPLRLLLLTPACYAMPLSAIVTMLTLLRRDMHAPYVDVTDARHASAICLERQPPWSYMLPCLRLLR